ncbi:alpha/beta-hydrolase [Testicularia cyperi]|uniref:Alpha/beta-hydrolase n=1 Tax=Testicularia cyperi TaxID=1882483 RepID=A0A317XSJ3_9BASI|nr:alpha/beta-hydrolase [Testicularia cyperi]
MKVCSLLCRCAGLAVAGGAVLATAIQQPWSDGVTPSLTLPPTPSLPPSYSTGRVTTHDGSSIWYGLFGDPGWTARPMVTFLHGGFGNSDYWGLQISHLVTAGFRCLAIDSRGHGRSVEAEGGITYDMMTHDVLAVWRKLGVTISSVVGWSDGGVIGLDLVMNQTETDSHPTSRPRVDKLFAFGASYSPANINTTINDNAVFSTYLNRTQSEFRNLNPRPTHLAEFEQKMNNMWNTLPAWSEESFQRIVPYPQGPLVWIVDGADEEAVNRTTPGEMSSWLPNSGLTILPSVSHFAFMQDPQTFNTVLRRFLEYP